MRSALVFSLALSAAPVFATPPPMASLTLPAGFHIAVWTDQVPDAREMALGTKNTVFVGSRDAGKVYAVSYAADGRVEKVRTVASGLKLPVGVAFHNGDLYVSAVSRIYVLRDLENHLDTPPKPELVTDKLHTETAHGWKFIAFGPDDKLYVPVGAPCNICDRGDEGFAQLLSMNPDGTGLETVAKGIRNTVGFDWRPSDKSLWFTDNGRDMLGDDLPSDELNHVTKTGEHFGYPYCHQGDTPDPEFGKGKDCKSFTPPVLKLGAHVAALGMRFYDGKQFPAAYRGAAIIAEHGSWNRTAKSGYRVMSVRFNGNKVASYEPLVEGFLKGEKVSGRPADVQPLPDGSLLISDDDNGAIYRVTYKN
ncbi:PQQ-dependent sugar dehydrogenase [Luteibacter sp. UNCMF366Tsu5.1]|uniref:PQQ-dependent sugar dehydrogenase n=1 Tax=Luteibacter sp. UNCMF366Tsu5.1 TaxID=1502758 RepID=UPI000908C101|nr:PQQ-dependent sugar dehydrogenase [Luteibacter sp. UNCMF366Tsu5.1]SFW70031.1 Glucose/arabinose dehydrogenase, beta-propeller fold [Luteibacter sp. UNCMF366Tsu5.1]